MSKNLRYIIIFALIFVAVGVILLFTFLNERIPDNPETQMGNTAGNIYNEGLFFEMDGTVYFANEADSGCMYKMNPDETGLKQITNMNVKYINGAGKYLYYYLDSTKASSTNGPGISSVVKLYGLYRSRLDGSKQECLDKDDVKAIQLYGNNLYYQIKTADRGMLVKISTSKKNRTVVNSEEMINPACNVNGVMYYNGTANDLDLHSLNTLSGDLVATVREGYFYNPIIKGTTVYYMDANNNYKLTSLNLVGGATTVLTEDRVDYFNMNDTHIFYASSGDNASLIRINLDGSNPIVIMPGITNSINLTSRYVYFRVYGVENVYYHWPLDGSASVSTFVPVK